MLVDGHVVIDLAFARARLVRCDPQRPLYRQLADMIRKIEGSYEGLRLPTERRLAQELKMARVTVRKALANLEREGIIQRRQGAGTYFASKQARRERVRTADMCVDAQGDRQASVPPAYAGRR